MCANLSWNCCIASLKRSIIMPYTYSVFCRVAVYILENLETSLLWMSSDDQTIVWSNHFTQYYWLRFEILSLKTVTSMDSIFFLNDRNWRWFVCNHSVLLRSIIYILLLNELMDYWKTEKLPIVVIWFTKWNIYQTIEFEMCGWLADNIWKNVCYIILCRKLKENY